MRHNLTQVIEERFDQLEEMKKESARREKERRENETPLEKLQREVIPPRPMLKEVIHD